ncbi:hypothetical protein C5B85_02765 [Pseudoclavibacter sp. AY1F1]|uniref:hypothetical protein n=1 Tax=Pseudoclavibacter sp. AY1F1 TaxID=2080583 RepID=UPI000CE8681D|nr:hypothetical protein [Pseudoclavibacter sp. AY1F1]PPF47213.1 hypothetical protein C5B85_02765 [Pseudoclavibacter sp. AY1F1]
MRSAAKQSIMVLALGLALVAAPLTPAAASPASPPPTSDAPVDGQLVDGGVQTPQPTATTPPTSDVTPAPVEPSPQPQPSLPPVVDAPVESSAPGEGATPTPTPVVTVPPTPLPPVPSAIPESRPSGARTAQCYGSSSIDYLCGGGYLGRHLAGWNVLNHGVGSIGPVAIGTIAGVYQTALARAVTIPSSGAVNLGNVTGLPIDSRTLGRIIFDVEIAGVAGQITHYPDLADTSLHWKFTRHGSGSAVYAGVGTAINSLEKPQPGSTSVLWVGANGIEDMQRVKDVISGIVEAGNRVGATSYVIQLPPRWDFSNPLNHNRHQVNDWIRATYGERAIPLADYLSNGALVDAGRVPSASDRETIAMGLNPRSFWMAPDDTTHMNAVGMNVAGRYLARWVNEGYTYSQAVLRFDVNSTAAIRVEGSRVTVSGHAFDLSDLYATIPVGITVDGAWSALTASSPSPQLGSYGVPGQHGYTAAFDLQPGSHEVCTVGIGFGAGQHSYPPCQTVVVAKQAAPLGSMAIADAPSRTKAIYGWTYGPSAPGRSLPVAILVDGSWHHLVAADRPSGYLSGVPGQHAFFTAAAFTPGNHTVCAVAIESSTNMANLGCQVFTIK